MLAAILMVKNEESSIKLTLDSVRDYVKHIVVFDTGSTDNTVNIIKKTCKKNNQVLHLKQGEFKTFPVSRNEAIAYAESCLSDVDFFLLLDAGDEFRSRGTKQQLLNVLRSISSVHKFGIIKKEWLTNAGTVDHYDIRVIRARRNCRYDDRYPVHELFAAKTEQNMILMGDLIVLYQDRLKYGASSQARMSKDIAMLSAAPITRRNYYHLAQTYVDTKDFENGCKYYKMALDLKEEGVLKLDSFEDEHIMVHIMKTMMFMKTEYDELFGYFKRIMAINPNAIDAYIYLLKYCIDAKLYDRATPYLHTLANLDKAKARQGTITHNYYDYLRWHFISLICLETGDNELGLSASRKAAGSNSVMDMVNANLFESRLKGARLSDSME
jgi:glycosyltransferase involved in cell wall biosynthesis